MKVILVEKEIEILKNQNEFFKEAIKEIKDKIILIESNPNLKRILLKR